jgi:hypothetical protein
MSKHDEKDLLTRELRERSEHVDMHPIGLDTVRRSARRIQWRRRAAGGAVAAAVLAVAVPVGLNLGGTTSSSPPIANQPSPTASTSSTPTPTPSEDPTSGTTVPEDGSIPLTTEGLSRGAAPGIEYLQGKTLVRTDGSTEQLPAAYGSIYPFRGGWIAVEWDNNGNTFVVQIDNTGAVVDRSPGGPAIAVSSDGVEIAYVVAGSNGGPSRLTHMIANGMAEGGDSIDVPDDATPVGFVAAGTVVYTTQGVKPKTWVTDFSETNQVPGVLGSRGATNGLIGALTSFNESDGTSCWKVLSNSLDEVSSTCDYTLQSFSQDGKHVFGWNSDSEGIGSRTVAILDPASGKPVTVFRIPNQANAFMTTAVWEDESHLLVAMFQDGAWHLVRLGIDGSVEDTVDPVPGEDVENPFRFSARP